MFSQHGSQEDVQNDEFGEIRSEKYVSLGVDLKQSAGPTASKNN